MTLVPGSRLGPYEILSAVGAGGMGEVYKARDTRLERTVAVKVLPARLSENAEFRQRFEREAKTISQLSHPHICTLHDVGHQDGVEYLVMEFLEGETLTERLARGPLPLEQVLRHGIEIADALEKAHRQGIIHRDLKPGNVMITKSGVKLVDFGLAKLAAPSPGGLVSSFSVLPTQAGENLTAEGTILGTFQYMAPEQLEGHEADARTDIFALGLVLYEMATGRKAFTGKSQASLIAAIIHTQPEAISSIQPMTPPALDRVVKTCLAKDPDDRFQTAHDVKLQLQWIAEGGSSIGLPAPVVARRKSRDRLGWAALGLVIGGTLAFAASQLLTRARPAEPRPVTWLSVALPVDAPLALYRTISIALSPNSRYVAYSAERTSGGTQLYLRSLATNSNLAVPDSEDAVNPFFSPDSRWVAFASSRELRKMPVEGGASQRICSAVEIRGASWGPADRIVFATGTLGMWEVSANGGSPRRIIDPNARKGEISLTLPEMLPSGDVLFTNLQGAGGQIEALSLSTGARRPLVEGIRPHYTRSGHLLFSRGTSLLAAPFDLRTLRLTGPPVSVIENLLLVPPFNSPLYSISDDGTLLYATGSAADQTLVWVDRHGAVEPLSSDVRPFEEPRLSPDGSHLAVTVREQNADVWVRDLTRGTWMRLTFDPGEDETVGWTPDGKRLTFASSRAERPRVVFGKAADGSGAEEKIFESSGHPHVSAWSSDGRTLLVTEYNATTQGDIWTYSADGGARLLLATPAHERAARLSPDGKWFVYVSDESGRDEVYVQAFPGPGGRWQISYGGGTEPVWSRNGKELFYRSADRMMAVDVVPETTFSFGTPHIVFDGRFVTTRRGEPAYDVTADGQRFLMVRRDPRSNAARLNIVLNWGEDLKARVNAGKR